VTSDEATKMTQVVGQPASLPNGDTSGEHRTIASIEMLDAIELEALIGQPIVDAFRPPRAVRHWVRQWITTRRPGPFGDGRLTLPSRHLAKLRQSLSLRESCMLRRSFDASPLTRLVQASVLIAFATGLMVLAMQADKDAPRMAAELTSFNIVAP
jgi:hypothetical protein